MSDIFSGTQAPAWLTERAADTTRRGQWGANAGTALAGLLNAFKREQGPEIMDEQGNPTGKYEKGPRQGFMSGVAEARLNQADPMWRLREQQIKASLLGNMAQANAANALAIERQNENAGLAEDSPWLARAAGTPADKFEAESSKFIPPSGWKSQGGWKTYLQIEKQKMDEVNAVRKDKALNEYKSRVGEMEAFIYGNPELGAKIAALPGQGRLPANQDGISMYSPEAWREYELFRSSKNLPPSSVSKETAAAIRQKEINETALKKQEVAGAQKVEQIGLTAENRMKELEAKNAAAEKLQDKRILGMQQLAIAKDQRHADYTQKRIQWMTEQKKELMAIKAKEMEARDSIYAAAPKEYPQPDGSVIVTWGRSMQVLKAAQNSADNLRLKTEVGILSKNIKDLSAMAMAMPDDEKIRGQLLDEQIKLANVFQKHAARKITAKQAKEAANPVPDEDIGVSTISPVTPETKIRRYNPATDTLE